MKYLGSACQNTVQILFPNTGRACHKFSQGTDKIVKYNYSEKNCRKKHKVRACYGDLPHKHQCGHSGKQINELTQGLFKKGMILIHKH